MARLRCVLLGVLGYCRVEDLIQFGLVLVQLAGHLIEHATFIIIQSHNALSRYIAPLYNLAHGQ